MSRCFATLAAAGCAAWAHAAPALQFAYWEPDRGTPYSWFEGAKDIQSFFSEDYRAAGFIKAYVRNEGDRPLKPSEFRLNGTPLPELREQYSVVWWRLLPSPLPPGAVGEIAVRLREPLTEAATLSVAFEGGETLEASVTPEPPSVRIETVGFTETMDGVFLVVEALDRKPHQLRRVLLDGQPVEAKLLDPSFSQGVSPIQLQLPQPLAEGSYHTYSVEVDDRQVACSVRTYDGWVPLGTYGYGDFEEFARNGCNGHNNFGRFTKGDLDSQATLRMRGVNIIGDAPPAEHMIGHPGLWAYCLMDEPDCQDYFHADEWPADKRIGYHAMELERRCQVCRDLDPGKPIFLTVNLTYKPANYYIYGQLADVTNPDCYPLVIGQDLRMVRECVETARYGTGPRPMTFTFETYYLEPTDPAALEKKRFARPPTAEELRLSIHYALGAGARGLYNYIHCTEKWNEGVAHGTRDYPDLWREMGRCYRAIDAVAPLVALAHPTSLATSSDEKVWVRTLLTGPEAALIVCCNEDYTQEKTACRVRPREGVVVELPELPWLKPNGAWRVAEAGLEPLRLEGSRVELGRLEAAELVLVANDPRLAETLWSRHAELERDRAEALLLEWRRRQDLDARTSHATRRLLGEFADRVAMGTGVSAYGVSPDGFWNPAGEQYPAFEFGQNEAGDAPDQGAEWKLTVPPEQAGKPHSIYAICGSWGEPGEWRLTAPGGTEALREEVSRPMSGELVRLRATPPEAGEYTLTFLVKGPGPKGGRVSHAVFVIPDELGPPGGP
ncbi:MAG: hypothetical protein FJX74_15865 [Armatimonadetes bacterium]|nr:hypothetical protein [Armatimonadota bacterium]